MITGTLRQPGKVTMLQKCMLLFLGCFFFGVFLANFSLHDEALWIGFLHENQVRQFAGAEDVEHAEALLKTILLQRGLPWMILLIALCFRFGRAVCAGSGSRPAEMETGKLYQEILRSDDFARRN